jgi:outer membrane receptor protein involved in Fe transport
MKRHLLLACASALSLGAASPAWAQTAPTGAPPVPPSNPGEPNQGSQAEVSTETTSGEPDRGGDANEIIVTAQKREQALNDVGLTVQAATGETLALRGIGSPEDLAKLVPGFSYTESIYSTPVFTLRGIGLFDATFGAPPSVAVYTDQIPRNVPVMSEALDLDIERVEVLKGPQGTLFGQSATGGAINYIPAKPTNDLRYGADFSAERFGRFDLRGFVSGPLAPGLRARLAVAGTTGGDYQFSISRPDDENGATRRLMGRLTVDWEPTERLRFEASATGVLNRSDVQAPQYLGTNLNVYSTTSLAAANANPATRNPFGVVNDALYAGITTPGSPNFDASFLARQETVARRLNGANPALAFGANALLGTPTRPNSNRAAEWTEGFLGKSDNKYYQLTFRADLELTDVLTLTSLSALAKQTLDYNQDVDATAAQGVDVPLNGNVRSFNQEVRLAIDTDRFNGIVGAVYDNIRSRQDNLFLLGDYSGNEPIPGIFIGATSNEFDSQLKTYGAFANGEFEFTPNLTAIAGVRYTKNKQDATYCYNDPIGAGPAQVFSIFEGLFGNPGLPPLQAGQCFPLGDGQQGTTFGRSTRDPVTRELDQDNWSYRVGLNYKFDQGTLLYATVSQGYKTGIFSAIGASSTSQYAAAVQEKVVAYEAGFKTPLFDRRLQLNAAAFYYDYTDKQVRGRIADPIFGLLEKLINVPKSYVFGIEADLVARPLQGLVVSASATYLKARVDGTFEATEDGSPVYNAAGYTGDFDGAGLPYTPEFSGNLDVQYEWDLNPNLGAFVGGNVLYQGSQNTTFANANLPADDFNIPDYATVDLRAGVESQDGRWRLTVFGRNVFNEVYTTSVTTYLDTLFRFTGRPATYGVSVAFRY